MSNSGGFAVTRTHGSDRFYNPPAVRRNQQLVLQQQQQQLQRPLKSDARVDSLEAETRTDSDESSLSRPNSVSSSSPPRTANLTNLDRLMESVTPFVPAQFLSEVLIVGNHEKREKFWIFVYFVATETLISFLNFFYLIIVSIGLCSGIR